MDVSVPSKNRPPSRCNHVVMVSNLGSNLFNGYFFFSPSTCCLPPNAISSTAAVQTRKIFFYYYYLALA